MNEIDLMPIPDSQNASSSRECELLDVSRDTYMIAVCRKGVAKVSYIVTF